MKIRPAGLADLPHITDVAVSAFADDLSYAHFYPWRNEFPEDFYWHLFYKYKKIMVTPGQVILVAELDKRDIPTLDEFKLDYEKGKIVAFITLWRTGGTQEQVRRWNRDTVFKRIERMRVSLQNLYAMAFMPNRAVDQDALDSFWTQAFTVHATTPFTRKLDIMTLAVRDEYQRTGFGVSLLRYVGYLAHGEKIPVFGDATEKGLPLYLKNGCKDIGQIVMPERAIRKKTGKVMEEFVLKRLETPVMRWDSEGYVTPEMLEEVRAEIRAQKES